MVFFIGFTSHPTRFSNYLNLAEKYEILLHQSVAKAVCYKTLKLNVKALQCPRALDLLPCIMGYRNNLRTRRSQSESSWGNITTFQANQGKWWLKLKLPSQPGTVTLLVLGAGVCGGGVRVGVVSLVAKGNRVR